MSALRNSIQATARSFARLAASRKALWASGEIDTRELERQARYGAGVCILGVLTGEHRERVTERLRAIERGPRAAVAKRRTR